MSVITTLGALSVVAVVDRVEDEHGARSVPGTTSAPIPITWSLTTLTRMAPRWRRPKREAGGSGCGLQQTHADLLAVLVDALDQVPVEFELANDDGREVSAQLVERHRLLARRSVVAPAAAIVWVVASAIDRIPRPILPGRVEGS